MHQNIKVLVADGSGYVRLVMSDILNAVPGIEVVDTAYDGEDVLLKVEHHQPNVIILDIDLPNAERLITVKQLLKQNNTALIISGRECDFNGNLDNLQKSASSYLTKPDNFLLPQLRTIAEDLIKKVKDAANQGAGSIQKQEKIAETLVYNTLSRRKSTYKAVKAPSHLIVIGASTGGAPAIEFILRHLPEDFSASVFIAQHMPPGFSVNFIKRLNNITTLEVEEARSGLRVEAGKIYVALPETNMVVKTLMGSKTNLSIEFSYEDYSLYDRPSIDLLMQSCAAVYEERTIGVILSGMGKDGTIGLKAIQQKGGYTIAQDQSSSAIFGMAKVAIEEGCVDKVLHLAEIPNYIFNYVKLNENQPSF